MNQRVFNQVRTAVMVVLTGISIFGLAIRADNKLTSAEMVAKHLDSIGSAEARARVHGTQIKGACSIEVRQGGNGRVDGQVLMASQGDQNLINMTFEAAEYPRELFRFDGKKFTAAQLRPGQRSILEQFFVNNESLFREGLVGGTLSSSWPLLDMQTKNPKLEYLGIKKIDGKQLHALKYTPRKGSDLKITLFFDVETFQHVRTEYQQTVYSTEQTKIGGGGGALPQAADQRSANARIEAYETFTDFKVEGGLNLPHNYKFHLSIQSETRPALVDWEFNLNKFDFNAPLDAKSFAGIP